MSVIIEGGISITGNITVGDVPLPLTFLVQETGTHPNFITAENSDLIIMEIN